MQIAHDPIHPHLHADSKDFEETFSMGRFMEELARPLLHEMFADCRMVAHCDATRDTRRQGKRMTVRRQEYILPDFEISAPQGFACYLDVKSKQYHSFYHLQQQLQQFVNKSAVDEYQVCAAASHMPCLLLIHLWPGQAMHAYGQGDAARIHTGMGHPLLDEATLTALLQRWPVDDWYYLTTASYFQQGRLGRNEGALGYYAAVSGMHAAERKGCLPNRGIWETLCAQERQRQGWDALQQATAPATEEA